MTTRGCHGGTGTTYICFEKIEKGSPEEANMGLCPFSPAELLGLGNLAINSCRPHPSLSTAQTRGCSASKEIQRGTFSMSQQKPQ